VTTNAEGAPQGVAAELVARAASAYQAHDWSTALVLYRRIRDTFPVIAIAPRRGEGRGEGASTRGLQPLCSVGTFDST
jgi:hypothetical protein